MLIATKNTPPASERWSAWDRFLEITEDTGFMQSSWWADFRAMTGYEHFGIVVRHGDALVGGALVFKFRFGEDKCFYYIPEGPVLPRDDASGSAVFSWILREIARRREREDWKLSHLRIEPRWQNLPHFIRGFRALPTFVDRFVEPRSTLCVDLRPPEEEILARMRADGRHDVRVASRLGVRVVEDPTEQGVADFLKIHEETTARQGIQMKPPEYFRRLVAILSAAQHGSIYFAEFEGIRLAAAIVVWFGGRATYFFGGSRDTLRRVRAPAFLQFEIMKRLKERGIECYDLWGAAPEDDPRHPWQKFTDFKRKFGGSEYRFVPTLDYVFDAGAYEQYSRVNGTKKQG